MKGFHAFVVYPFVVLLWAGKRLWKWRTAVGITTATTSGVALLIGLLLYSWILEQWPELNGRLPAATDEIWVFALYVCAPAIGVGLIVFTSLVISAPSQMHRDLKEKLAGYEDAECGLELFLDKDRHFLEDGSGLFQNWKIGVRRVGPGPVMARTVITKAEARGGSSDDKKRRQDRVDELVGMPLQADHKLGEDEQVIDFDGAFDVLNMQGEGSLYNFYHTVRDPNTHEVIHTHGRIPVGRYAIGLRAEGRTIDGNTPVRSDEKTAIVYLTKSGKLKMKIDN